jgi:hypothetical protein
MKNDMKMKVLAGLSTDWMVDAKCRNEDKNTAAFFEEFERGSGTFKNKMVFFCRSCPVITDCYQYAIDADETGLWGGAYFTSGRPRNPLRARYLESDRDRAASQKVS